MVGGGNRRDDGPIRINSTNVFAALETLKKKKKSDKESSKKGSSKHRSSKGSSNKEPEPQPAVWAPTTLNATSWADVEDDDDDFYANTAPLQTSWGHPDQRGRKTDDVVDEVLF
jgi:hypothetical protein